MDSPFIDVGNGDFLPRTFIQRVEQFLAFVTGERK